MGNGCVGSSDKADQVTRSDQHGVRTIHVLLYWFIITMQALDKH